MFLLVLRRNFLPLTTKVNILVDNTWDKKEIVRTIFRRFHIFVFTHALLLNFSSIHFSIIVYSTFVLNLDVFVEVPFPFIIFIKNYWSVNTYSLSRWFSYDIKIILILKKTILTLCQPLNNMCSQAEKYLLFSAMKKKKYIFITV